MFVYSQKKYFVYLSIAFLFIANQLNAQNQISGLLISSKGDPIAYASIRLLHQKAHSFSDQQGQFYFHNLQGCKDTLVIEATGFKQKRHMLELTEDTDTLQLKFTLTDTAINLKTVTVHGDLTPDNKSIYVARMPLKNLENPQVYNVVSQLTIKEQQITNITDLMRNVPGTVPNNTSGGYFSITSRGFTTYVNARNGASVGSYFTSYDPSNIERIEVLKGPSGTLYQAAASYGGAVNLVTKRPEETPFGSITYTMGSWGLNRAMIDYNHPLDTAQRFLFRFEAAADREKTFQDFGHSNIYSLSPSFKYKVSDKWNILAEFELYNSEKTPIPWQSFGPLYKSVKEIPNYEKAYAADDLNTKLMRQNATITNEYQINKNWLSSTVIAALNSSVDHNYFAYNYYLARDTFRRYIYDYDYNYSSANIQQNFIGNFTILGLKNKMVAGLEFVTTRFNYAGYASNYDTVSVYDFQPMLRKNVNKFIDERPTYAAASNWTQSRYAAYASDLVYLSKRLMAMLSLRMDRYVDHQPVSSYHQTAFSPKLGLVYQPILQTLSIFANYNDGFSNQNTATKKDGSIAKLDPVHATQYEGGIKWDSPNSRYSATLSLYNIQIHNANLYDKEGFFDSQAGKQRSRGLELEFKASPTEYLNIMLGYGYNENKYTKSSSYQGNLAANAPYNLVNGWINYKIPLKAGQYLSLGAGGNFVDKAYSDVYNQTAIPSYLLMNAVLGYHIGQTLLGIRLNNLSDIKYYSGSGNPMPPRNYAATVSFSF